jgi:hypothetical protein
MLTGSCPPDLDKEGCFQKEAAFFVFTGTENLMKLLI